MRSRHSSHGMLTNKFVNVKSEGVKLISISHCLLVSRFHGGNDWEIKALRF